VQKFGSIFNHFSLLFHKGPLDIAIKLLRETGDALERCDQLVCHGRGAQLHFDVLELEV